MREEKKYQSYWKANCRFWLTQLANAIMCDLYDYQRLEYNLGYGRYYDLDYAVSACSLDIFIKGENWEYLDIAHLAHIHSEDIAAVFLSYRNLLEEFKRNFDTYYCYKEALDEKV